MTHISESSGVSGGERENGGLGSSCEEQGGSCPPPGPVAGEGTATAKKAAREARCPRENQI